MDKVWICLLLLGVAWGSYAQSNEAAFADDENWNVDEVEKLGILDDNKGNVEENNEAPEVLYDYELNSDINAQKDINNKDENENIQQNNENVEIPSFDSDVNVQNEIDLMRNEDDANINGNLEENEREPEKPGDYDFGHDLFEDDNYGFDYNVLKDDQDDLKNFFADDNDYQYEDNRSDLKEERDNQEVGKFSDSEGTFDENEVEIKNVGKNEDTNNVENIVEESQSDDVNDFADILEPQLNDQSDIDTILKETQDILNELDNSQDSDFEKNDIVSNENVENIVQESQEEAVDANHDAESEVINPEKLLEDENEDTLDKVYDDLNSDLDKLVETMDTLLNDDNPENNEEIVYPEINNEVEAENNVNEKANLQMNNEENEEIEDIINEDDSQVNNDGLYDFGNLFDQIDNDGLSKNNHLENENDYDDEPKINDTVDKVIEPEINGNDNFVEDEQLQNENDDEQKEIKKSDSETENEETVDNVTFRTIKVDDLSSSELNDLMDQFAEEHSEDLDFKAPGFDRNIAPVYITLNTDEPVIVSSPNYPSPYPTNNIVDWMLDGNGMGIEMNITDFAVNGALGDYLLIKPGGIDESGEEGLIFSYHLDKPRIYRFLSVDKMFVRFESKIGMMFFRGFSMSVKLVGPRQEIEDTVASDDEIQEEVAEPTSTLTVSLGGVTLQHFKLIKEEFRMIIADMATMYVNAQGINPGSESTINVTQITRAVMCNLNWPNFETCSEVSFAVPLKFEDLGADDEEHLTQEELQEMWDMFVFTDPFRSRLARLGITEFAAPNDRAALSVWAVLVLGVLISVMLLGLMLWRFSCREDYKRMPSFSDADSVYDKRGLDLYPTPHQNLPPLYSQSDYKWVDHHDARVDIGGFANKSYTPDELGELDSEDDVISQHRNHVLLRNKIAYGDFPKRLVSKTGMENVALISNVPFEKIRLLNDTFHTLINLRWRWIVIGTIVVHFAIWLVFAVFWYITALAHYDFDPDPPKKTCITGGKDFVTIFLASVEAQTTIGFGDRTIDEECPESIFLFIMQLILGTGLSGVLTCVVYAKLTRPEKLSRDGVGFSKKAVVSMRDGELCLMMRAWDLNYDHIIGSEFSAHFINAHRTKEGEVIRYHARCLQLQQRQFLIWPVTLVHVIDQTSPLYHLTQHHLSSYSYEITLSLKGASASMGTYTQSQTSYLPKEVVWGHRFPSVVKYDCRKQKYVIDYKRLDYIEPIDTPSCSASELNRSRKSSPPSPIRCPSSPSSFSDKISSFHLQRSSSFKKKTT